jgi:hypothetical protein
LKHTAARKLQPGTPRVSPVTTPHLAAERFHCAQLFLAMLLGMSLHCLFSMPSGMNYVTPRSVSVVCRLFVMSSIMVLGGFFVVVGVVLKMF